MRRLIELCLVVLLLGAAAPAAARAQAQGAPTVAHVRMLLSSYERGPGLEVFRRLGPGALDVLIGLYDDPAEAWFVRLRAVGATAAFPSPRAHAFLMRVAAQQAGDPLYVRAAALALGRAFGKGAVGDLTKLLTHPEPLVRRGAARALSRMHDGAARAHLRARAAVEPDPAVRRAMERMLASP